MGRFGRGMATLVLGVLAGLASIGPAAADPLIDSGYGDAGTAQLDQPCEYGTTPEVSASGLVFVLGYCFSTERMRLTALDDQGARLWASTVALPRLVRKNIDYGPMDNSKVVWGADSSAFVLMPVRTTDRHGDPTIHFFVEHLLPDGSRDLAYGNNSVAHVALNGNLADDWTIFPSLDSNGRLVVTTAGYARTTVLRFTRTGRLDHHFSKDGQARVPCKALTWSGLDSADRSAVACSTQYRVKHHMADSTTVFRLKPNGARDRHFGKDGTAVVKNKTVHGAPQGFMLDERSRLNFVVCPLTRQSTCGSWIDLERLSATGHRSRPFADATVRISSPKSGKTVGPIGADNLEDLDGHVSLSWGIGRNHFYLTAYGDDGSRWTALGPDGTQAMNPYLATDTAWFYPTSAGLYIVDYSDSAAQATRYTMGSPS